MDIWQILMTPFSWLLKLFCQVFDSYGIALFLFTIVIKIVLFPLNLKGKKGMIKMNVLNAQVQEIQKRCGNDKERYNQEVQKFYAENNASPMSGCGWQLIPIAVLYPLYAIIRRPLKYMMWLTEDAVKAVASAVGWTDFTIGGSNELILASMLNTGNLNAAKAAVGASAASVFIINFDFFGIDLSQVPKLMFWENGLNWGSIGLFLLPVISAVLSVVSSLVLQKTNQMNKDQPAPKMNWSIMLMAPLMSLWIGFALPAGMCIYWIANSLLGMVQELICGRMLRKDYEAAQKEMEEQACGPIPGAVPTTPADTPSPPTGTPTAPPSPLRRSLQSSPRRKRPSWPSPTRSWLPRRRPLRRPKLSKSLSLWGKRLILRPHPVTISFPRKKARTTGTTPKTTRRSKPNHRISFNT